MKKIFLFAIVAFCVINLVSCGSKKSESDKEDVSTLELKPESQEIGGQLEGCFTVVDKTYKVKLEEFLGGVITVELKRTDYPLPFETDGRSIYSMASFSQSAYVQVGFGIEFLDAEGNIVEKMSPSSTPYSGDEAVELVQLADGATGSIQFNVGDDAKEAVTFRITSAYRYGGVEGDSPVESFGDDNDVVSVVADDDEDISSQTSSELQGKSSVSPKKIDALLNEYEAFANKYAPFLKKVKNGTITASSPEYAQMVGQASQYALKLQEVTDDMSPQQIARLATITAKMGNL